MRPAAGADLPWARDLLAAAGLPPGGLEDQFPAAYVVLEGEGGPLGLAGLERYGAAGLLRSVAVAAGCRGTGAGAALVADRLARARADGLSAVYLLTTTAADWFPRFGFRGITRAELPAELGAAPEVAGGCPASAAVMRLALT
ncbi:MAG TPA: arsenic resistance N-acetyltransferase ArsN2 [Gemmatimonadales bacterium]|nr:arsenic resistance N-acetyltransferase ArsN2 [Gemmatimonadales bacterium]